MRVDYREESESRVDIFRSELSPENMQLFIWSFYSQTDKTFYAC